MSTKQSKYKVGDLVAFNAPAAFGGAHYKSVNTHYAKPGVITEVNEKHNGLFSYRVWWSGKYTNEHECYLTAPDSA